MWPSPDGAWTARLRDTRLDPHSSWALFKPAGALPRKLRRLLDDGQARWLLDTAIAAWPLRFDPLLEGVTNLLDPSRLGAEHGLGPRGRVLGYKPLRRAVLRFDDADGQARRFVKHVRTGRARETAERQAVLETWARAASGFSLPHLLEVHQRPDYLVWAAAPGVTVEHALRETRGRAAVATLGRCLASLHRHPARPPLSRSRVAELEATAAWISVGTPLLPDAGLSSTLHELKAVAGHLTPGRPVLSHCDLHDGQFLLGERRTYLLDFDTVALAEPELDLGNLLAHLDLLGFAHPQIEGLELEEILVEAYVGQRGPLPDRQRLSWYRALSVLRLACVHASRPETRHHAPRLAASAWQLTRDLCGTEEELVS
jgi:aminoglycoside phosphotransferase (APT) family kinase protein